MVNFKGNQQRRDYEEIQHNTFYLELKINEYRNHLSILSADTYRKFKLLKEDYENGYISKDTYLQFLQPVKQLVNNIPQELFSGGADEVDHLMPEQTDHQFCWRREEVHACVG